MFKTSLSGISLKTEINIIKQNVTDYGSISVISNSGGWNDALQTKDRWAIGSLEMHMKANP